LAGSPPERSPTPGEARLGDWMRKIEETITAQAIEIESLKKTVMTLRVETTFAKNDAVKSLRDCADLRAGVFESQEAIDKNFTNFRTALQANVDETAEAIEISEAKMSASVSDLRGTFDGQLQAAAETTDKKIDVVRADTVRSLVNQAKKIEEIQTSLDKQIREAVNQVVKEKLEVTDRPKFKKSAANGIFFTGLDIIAKREKWQGDITSVVHNILHKVGSAPYYTEGPHCERI